MTESADVFGVKKAIRAVAPTRHGNAHQEPEAEREDTVTHDGGSMDDNGLRESYMVLQTPRTPKRSRPSFIDDDWDSEIPVMGQLSGSIEFSRCNKKRVLPDDIGSPVGRPVDAGLNRQNDTPIAQSHSTNRLSYLRSALSMLNLGISKIRDHQAPPINSEGQLRKKLVCALTALLAMTRTNRDLRRQLNEAEFELDEMARDVAILSKEATRQRKENESLKKELAETKEAMNRNATNSSPVHWGVPREQAIRNGDIPCTYRYSGASPSVEQSPKPIGAEQPPFVLLPPAEIFRKATKREVFSRNSVRSRHRGEP